MNQDLDHQIKLNQLRAHLAAGEAEIARGEGVELADEVAIKNFFTSLTHREA